MNDISSPAKTVSHCVSQFAGVWFSTTLFILCSVLSYLGAISLDRAEEGIARRELQLRAEIEAARLDRRFQVFTDALYGARGFIISSAHVERAEWRTFASSRERGTDFAGMIGMGYIERVPRAELTGFIALQRVDGAPDFFVRSDGASGEAYIIKFVETAAEMEQLRGLDITSDQAWRTAAERAMRTGLPTVSVPVQLGQHAQAVVMILPVYNPRLPTAEVADREAALVGWIFAPVALDEVVLATRAQSAQPESLRVSIHDGPAGAGGGLLFGDVADAGGANVRQVTLPITIGTQRWTLAVSAPADRGLSEAARCVLACGLLIGAGFSFLVWSLRRSRAVAAAHAAEAVAAAQHSEEKSRALLESSMDAVLYLSSRRNKRGVVVNFELRGCNHRAERLLGRPRKDLSGMNLSELFPGSDERACAMLQRVIESGATCEEEWQCEAGCFRVRAVSGGGLVVVSLHDATAAKQYEYQLHETQMAYRMLAENIPQLFWTAAPDGTILGVNQNLAAFTGGNVAECIDEFWHRLVHPEDLEPCQGLWQLRMAQARAFELECRLRDVSGEHRWFVARVVPVTDEDGAVIKWFGTFTDIDRQKLAEEALNGMPQPTTRARRGTLELKRAVPPEEVEEPIFPALQDPELLELLGDFVDGLSSRVAEIGEALAEADWGRLTVLAHRLKGAGGFGYNELCEVAMQLEAAAALRANSKAIESLERLHGVQRRILAGVDLLQEQGSPEPLIES